MVEFVKRSCLKVDCVVANTHKSRRRIQANVRLFSLDRPLLIAFRRSDTAEAEMIGAGVDLAFAAGADNVARAVLVVAKK
jgi:hypothetical protein